MLEEKAVEVAIAAYKNRKAGKLYNGRTEIKDGLATGRRFKYKHEILARFRFAPDDGSREIWMLNFAAHPNSLGGDNRLLSAEYPYYLREKIAKKTVRTCSMQSGLSAVWMRQDTMTRTECITFSFRAKPSPMQQ